MLEFLRKLTRKSDKVVYVAIVNGDIKIFDSRSQLYDYCKVYSDENTISSLSMFKCELYNFIK